MPQPTPSLRAGRCVVGGYSFLARRSRGHAADRVTTIAYKKSDDSPVEIVAYAYDVGGQRIQKSLGGSAVRETPFTATYDAANRVTQITLNGEASSLAYDNNGNLAQKSAPGGTTTYTWTARNQLASIAGPSGSASFRYDAFADALKRP